MCECGHSAPEYLITIGSVSLSWIDIDDELLTAAMRELGTSTAQETVNAPGATAAPPTP